MANIVANVIDGNTINLVVTPPTTQIVTIDRGLAGPAGPAGPAGATGPQGPTGATGAGVIVGGTTGQVLAKASNTNYDTVWVNQDGNGTVTSVAATVPSFLSIAGSPITTSGTLSITYSGTALPIANGGTGATTAPAALTALGAYPASNPAGYTNTQYATITDDTTTNATRYPLLSSSTSGNVTVEYTSSTKLKFNPFTGALTVSELIIAP
jgi:hypothetical protein